MFTRMKAHRLAIAVLLILASLPVVVLDKAAADADQGSIVFVREGNIWTMNPDGSDQTQLTTLGSDSQPALSPDGNSIAYVRDFGDRLEIQVMRSDGTDAHCIAQLFPQALSGLPEVVSVHALAWLPDGERLVVAIVVTRGQNTEQYVLNVTGQCATAPSDLSQVDFGQNIGRMSWSASDQVVYEVIRPEPPGQTVYRDFDLWHADACGLALCDPLRLTGTNEWREVSPVLSPHSDKVLYARNRGAFNDDELLGEVRVRYLDGQGDELVYTAAGQILDVDWSPDGSQIVFFVWPKWVSPQWDPSTEGEVWVVNTDGTNPHKIAVGTYPAWQPRAGHVSPMLRLAPTRITILQAVGESNPSPWSLDVTCTGESVDWTATVSPSVEWMGITPAGGTTPGTVQLSFDVSDLDVDRYTTQVLVEPAFEGEDEKVVPQVVNVALILAEVVPCATTPWHIEIVDSSENKIVDPSLALDDAGRPHISYTDGFPWGDLKYACYDGDSWQIQTVEAGLETYEGYSSLALDDAGRPHISYYAHDSLKYAHYDRVSWQIETVDDTAPVVGAYNSLALDSAGNLHVSYWDVFNNFDLKYARYDGASWQIETVDGAGDVGKHTSLAVDDEGHPHISYVDLTNHDLKYAYHDGSSWQIEMVDDDGGDQPTSLALDDAGRPHISYAGSSPGYNLKHARHDGISWQIETVGVDSYGESSLALAGAGHPRLSFMRAEGGLVYACYDGDSWQIETVDSAGAHPSLVLGDAGNPHIGYMNGRDLEYAWQEAPTPTPTPTDTPTPTAVPMIAPTAAPTERPTEAPATVTPAPGSPGPCPGAVGMALLAVAAGAVRSFSPITRTKRHSRR